MFDSSESLIAQGFSAKAHLSKLNSPALSTASRRCHQSRRHGGTFSASGCGYHMIVQWYTTAMVKNKELILRSSKITYHIVNVYYI